MDSRVSANTQRFHTHTVRPGLGFEIDQKLLKKYGHRFFRLTETGQKFQIIHQKGLKTALELKKRKESQ